MYRVIRILLVAVCAAPVVDGGIALAQGQATLTGTVVDSLGARVSGASVSLMRDVR